MIKGIISSTLPTLLLLATSVKADTEYSRLRVDCRFFDDDNRFCYASAIYKIKGRDIFDIRYGVGCNYETLFDDAGITLPESTVSDEIRPKKAAMPKIEIFPQGALKNPGTYTAKLEANRRKLKDGLCYVKEVHDSDPYIFPDVTY